MNSQGSLLVSAVVAIGVLQTLVADHWAPIVVIARRRGCAKLETARAPRIAGSGHTITILILGAVVWFAGAELGMHFGDIAASVAVIALALGSRLARFMSFA